MTKKRKPIAEYAWCVANDDAGVVYPSISTTRKQAKDRFEHHAGMTLKTLPSYYLVKIYIATAKG
jgi:hypothetical protein